VLALASVLKAPSWIPKPVAPGLAGVAAAEREGVVVALLGSGAVGPPEPAADVPGLGATAPPLAAAAAAQALEGGAAAAPDGVPLLDAP
jgi:hypothetical protein